MIFTTWVYGLFLLVAVCVHWLCPARWRVPVLTVLGGYFYWYWFPPHLALIVVATLLVLGVGRAIGGAGGGARRGWLAAGVAACVGGLVYFKYQGLLADLVAPIAGGAAGERALPRPPLGISFFVFEYVHYLIEVYRGTFAPATLRDFGLFILFFPTLICGPIKRFGQFAPQEHLVRRLEAADVNAGLERILIGLAKKTLVADAVAPYCGPVLAFPNFYAWWQLWLGVYGYALQIYFDFAGYSDIAIGSARLLGYRVPENFDYPYLQPNIARFWRSWHMSLTSWITDYVYIPLGGNRRGEWRASWNRLASMTLCGLWHGAAPHFAVWGLYHGVALNLYRFWERRRGPRTGAPHWLGRAAGTVVTFHVVCIGWVLFVCDLETAWKILPRLLLLRP
jgi:alginate O-acetyltransferase complex protein AlgI